MEGEYLVKAVAPGGPADVMDEEDEGVPAIQPGDILVSVDGRVVQDASYGDLAGWILGPAGTVVQMKLRRGDESFQLSLSRAPLGDKERAAVKAGMERERLTLHRMLQVKKTLEKEKNAMTAEIHHLRKRVETAENEARVWKAISQQNSAYNSKAASPHVSESDSESSD